MSARLLAAALAAVAVSVALGASPARAQLDQPAGAAHAHFVASPQGDIGGGLSADIAYAMDIFRLGGFFGVVAVPSDEDTRNRIFMPLAASLGIELLGDVVGFSLRARGGLWGGATQEVKLTAGGFVGGGAYLLIALGPGVGISLGLDVWGLFGDGETALIAPGAGLSWSPAPPEPVEPSE